MLRILILYFLGASTSTTSSTFLPIKARAKGEVFEIFPEKGSASKEPTIIIFEILSSLKEIISTVEPKCTVALEAALIIS